MSTHRHISSQKSRVATKHASSGPDIFVSTVSKDSQHSGIRVYNRAIAFGTCKMRLYRWPRQVRFGGASFPFHYSVLHVVHSSAQLQRCSRCSHRGSNVFRTKSDDLLLLSNTAAPISNSSSAPFLLVGFLRWKV